MRAKYRLIILLRGSKERVTYKMIKEYIEAKYGFKVHTAYIAEVKRELSLSMYDAPNAVNFRWTAANRWNKD